MFDIRVKLNDSNNLNVFIDDIVIASSLKARKIVNDVKTNEMNDLKSNRDDDTRISIDVASEDDSNFNKFWASDSDSDSSSLYEYSENCNIDDDCNIGLEET